MTKPQLTLSFDTVSPFAYLAFYLLEHSTVFKQCDVTYRPILLGAVFKYCGNIAPVAIKNKDKWIALERIRWAKHFNIPISEGVPEGFPHRSLDTQRAFCALEMHHPDKVPRALAAVWDSYWVKRTPTHTPDALFNILKQTLGGQIAAETMEQSKSDAIKQRLTANTNKAIEEGCFGVPWFNATNAHGDTEDFWGFDHIGQVVQHLGLKGDVTESGWRAVL